MTAEHETPPMIEVLEFVSLDRPWTNDEHAEVQRALEATRYVVTGASTPEALRRRAARAYYRCAAVEALRGNNLTEHQKGWLVSWTEGPGAAAVVLDAWAESADPHAALVTALRALCPELPPVDVAAAVTAVVHGWTLATPGDEADYEPSPAQVRRALRRQVARVPELCEAVDRWLDVLPASDVERRVLHAGCVYAAADDRGRMAQLLSTLPDGAVAHAQAVWAGFEG